MKIFSYFSFIFIISLNKVSTVCSFTVTNVFHFFLASATKEKRSRQTYTRQQTLELEKEFNQSRYLTRRKRIEISNILSLTERQIKIWFQNRRMKAKKDPVNMYQISPHSEYNVHQTPIQSQYYSNFPCIY